MKPFVFFGTPEYSKITLETLVKNGFIPSLVICSPDAPIGRKQIMTHPPVKVFADEHNIPVFQPKKINETAVQIILDYGPKYAVVAAYGKILPAELIDALPYGFLNIHPSLLPKYRGPAPLEAPILNNDNKTGISIMLLDELVDHGPILKSEEFPLIGDEYAKDLGNILFEKGAEILCEIIPKWLNGEIEPVDQNHEEATFTKKITKNNAFVEIDDILNTKNKELQKNIWAKWRAHYPWPGMYFEIPHNKKNLEVELLSKESKMRIKVNMATFEDCIFKILRVTPEGKHEISFEEFKQNYL